MGLCHNCVVKLNIINSIYLHKNIIVFILNIKILYYLYDFDCLLKF